MLLHGDRLQRSAAVGHLEAGLLAAIREALAGSPRDYTEGSIPRAILILAVPMVLEMIMESVFAVVDVFFVARLGADAVATVGLTESMLTLVYTLAMGLSIGATAMVARRIGERDPDGAARAAMQAIALGVFCALVLGAICFGSGLAFLQPDAGRGGPGELDALAATKVHAVRRVHHRRFPLVELNFPLGGAA